MEVRFALPNGPVLSISNVAGILKVIHGATTTRSYCTHLVEPFFAKGLALHPRYHKIVDGSLEEEQRMGSMMGREEPGRKLTVAHFMPWSGIGGTEIAVLRMIEATAERFRNVVFCLPDAEALRTACASSGIETVTYIPPEPSLVHVGKFYKRSREVARQIKQADVDIVHFSDLKAAYHCSFAALVAGTRRVSHFRVTYPHLSLRERICLIPIQSFIFVSQAVRQSFAISIPDRRARVIYDAVEVCTEDMTASNAIIRQDLGVPPDCVLVGMVARVSPQKDYFTLALAAAQVLRSHPNTLFLVVGDNSLVDLNRAHYKEVMQRLNQLGIADRFIFTGHREDVPQLISAMDIAVLSTHREGFGLCIVESMAMRKPVVATAVGGLLEVVRHGTTGYLHQHENSQELADAIICLIENPATARRLGEAGYQHVKQSFSRKLFVDELSSAYFDVMRR